MCNWLFLAPLLSLLFTDRLLSIETNPSVFSLATGALVLSQDWAKSSCLGIVSGGFSFFAD